MLLLQEEEEEDASARSSSSSLNPAGAAPAPGTSSSKKPPPAPAAVQRTVHFQGQALAIETRWGVGIGGDIWTTGFLLCHFLQRHHAFFQRVFAGARILYVCLSSLSFGRAVDSDD